MRTSARKHPMEMGPSEAFDAIFHDHGVLVDVRFEEEVEGNELPGAVHLPLAFLQRFCGADPEPHCERFSHRDLTPKERTDLLTSLLSYSQQDKWLFCVCRSGARSLSAVEILRALGYRNAYSLKGGLRAWEDLLAARHEAEQRDEPIGAESCS